MPLLRSDPAAIMPSGPERRVARAIVDRVDKRTVRERRAPIADPAARTPIVVDRAEPTPTEAVRPARTTVGRVDPTPTIAGRRVETNRDRQAGIDPDRRAGTSQDRQLGIDPEAPGPASTGISQLEARRLP